MLIRYVRAYTDAAAAMAVRFAAASFWPSTTSGFEPDAVFRVDRHFLPDHQRKTFKKCGTTAVSSVIFDGSVP